MKRPLAYITAAWSGEPIADTEQAARYCRAVYDAGFPPVCPLLYLPLFLNDEIPEEHKSGIDMGRDLLRRAHVLSTFLGLPGRDCSAHLLRQSLFPAVLLLRLYLFLWQVAALLSLLLPYSFSIAPFHMCHL